MVTTRDAQGSVTRQGQGRWRVWLFRIGVAAATISLIACVVSWGDPFPLVHHDNGDLSISPRFDRLLAVAGCGAFATIFLALFGRGVKRLLLAVAGLLMLFPTYGALLSNGV